MSKSDTQPTATRKAWPRSPAFVLLALVLAMAPAQAQQQQQPSPQRSKPMKIRLTLGDTVLTATLRDNATARDFAAQLPLTLTLTDYAATEKVGDLPRKLTTKGAPEGAAAKAGDIGYYAPWGNLALYHKDFRYSEGVVMLGTLDGGVEALRRPGPLKVTFERAE